jgi:hypothetical protein
MEEYIHNNSENITPMCLNKVSKSESKTESSKIVNKIGDEAKLLRVFLNDMKKKLNFVEKTNWMFKNSFDVSMLDM